jgi:hypothetical protein
MNVGVEEKRSKGRAKKGETIKLKDIREQKK